jgi:hypothetical protein
MKKYSFLDTILLISGVAIEGFDEGDDVISLERLDDSATHKIGSDGAMSVAISADRSGTVTFRLMQTSSSNIFLSGLVTAQENGVFVPAFVLFRDTKGNDFGSGTQGYIKKPANMTRGKGLNSQEWVIVVERLDMLHLGS